MLENCWVVDMFAEIENEVDCFLIGVELDFFVWTVYTADFGLVHL